MNFNLKGWKKIKDMPDHAVLKHPTGHELKISKDSLNPEMLNQLHKLPVQKFAYGDEVEDTQHGNYDVNPDLESQAAQTMNQNIDSSAQDYQNKLRAEKGVAPISKDAPKDSVTKTQSSADTPVSSGVAPASVETPLQDSSPQTDPDPYGVMKSFQGQLGALNEEKQGQQGIANVSGQLGAQTAQAEQDYQTDAQKNLASYQKNYNDLAMERQNLQSDIANGHIDPKNYLENMSTGSKIATGLGLILGGMGAGLTHGPNLAFQYLQNQIDRDMEAQKAELGKKQNLLAHNLQATNDLRAATDMTRLQTNDMLSSHLKQLAGGAASDAAKYTAMTVAGTIDSQSAKLQHDLAVQKMQNGAFSGDGTPSATAIEMLPADKRERIVQMPAGGIRLALTKDGAKDLNGEVASIRPIFDQLDKLGQLGNSALIPNSPAAHAADAIRAQLVPLIQSNAGFKRLSEVDMKNNENMFSDPTKFSQLLGGQAKTQAYKQFLQDKLMSNFSSQLEGGYKPMQSQQSAPQVKGSDGKMYVQRGKYMVPVAQ